MGLPTGAPENFRQTSNKPVGGVVVVVVCQTIRSSLTSPTNKTHDCKSLIHAATFLGLVALIDDCVMSETRGTLSVRYPDEGGLQGHARCLFGGSKTRGRCRRRFTRERYVYIVDAEHGGLPLRVPPNCNGGSKFITVLNVGPGVLTDVVAPAHNAIHE
jgi:hypothetical protein